MKIKHIIVTLLTLCLLLSIAACDKVDEPPANAVLVALPLNVPFTLSYNPATPSFLAGT